MLYLYFSFIYDKIWIIKNVCFGRHMKRIIRELEETLGFSNKESLIYEALLQLGEGTVIEIAERAGLKRTTVYNLLPSMIRSGLVETALKKRKRYFFVDDVRKLKTNLVEKEKKLNILLPELQALHNILPQKPKITYFEGEGGLKELYRDTLKCSEAGELIRAYTGMEGFYDVFPKDFAEEYIEERVRRKIPIKVIAPDNLAARDWVKSAPQNLREIKLIKNLFLNFKADMEIYADKVALITYVPDFVGVIIESREINELQKSAFDLMWRSLS